MSIHTSLVAFKNADGSRANVIVESAGFLKSRGLMNRTYLPKGQGMLFSYSEEDDWAFWMKNTYIALDLIFINAAYEVVGILEGVPLSHAEISLGMPSQYIVETNRGWAEENNVTIGSKALFF